MESLTNPIEQIWQEYPLGRKRPHNYYAKRKQGPSIKDIIYAASLQFKMPVDYILADRRKTSVVYARHIAMHVAYVLTHNSTTMIGRVFGGRDHTTVLHAVYKIEDWIKEGRDEVINDVFMLKARAVEVSEDRMNRIHD